MDKRFLTRESIKSIIKINLSQQNIDCKDFKDSMNLKIDLKLSKHNLFYLINSMQHNYKINISTNEVFKLKNVGKLVDYFNSLIHEKNIK